MNFLYKNREYTLYSPNGNVDVIDFKPAFHDRFVKDILGSEVCLYEIYFENIIKENPSDPNMEKTVGEILRHFMEIHENSIVYYSINRSDGRNLHLFRLYSIWFGNMCRKIDGSIQKLDRKIIENSVFIDHISCLFRKRRFNEVDMARFFDHVLNELYPNCEMV